MYTYANIHIQILDERKAGEKDRLAFIIFLSDGKDEHLKDPNKIKDKLNQLKLKYPIHAFGVSEEDSSGAQALRTMADATSGSYTSMTQGVDTAVVAEKLAQLSDKLTSLVAVDVSIHLRSLHPAVSLLRIESSSSLSSSSSAGDAGDAYKSQIGDDKLSAEIAVGAVSSGEEREFTVYLYVPEGPQGNDDGVTMELLAVRGSYKQSWDQEQVALGESVVTVARPPPPRGSLSTSSCKELEWIEERVEYWNKVKLDLSAMYGKLAEAEEKCQVTEALQQASMEAIDRAMHHDIYTVCFIFIHLFIYIYHTCLALAHKSLLGVE